MLSHEPRARRRYSLRAAAVVAAIAGAASPLVAQDEDPRGCESGWLPGGSIPGIDGIVHDMTWWDPDAAGPQPAVLVVVGMFWVVEDQQITNMAIWNPASGEWSAFEGTFDRYITAITVVPAGPKRNDLVIGGAFTVAGGSPANRLARWNGAAWTPLGPGVTGAAENISDLVTLPDGRVLVCGRFTSIGSVTVNNIAVWNGTSWRAIGSGLGSSSHTVSTAVVASNGDIIAGGSFSYPGGNGPRNISRWNGTSWTSFGTGWTNGVDGSVSAIAVMPNGDIIAGGGLSCAWDHNCIFGPDFSRLARWDGTAWSRLGDGLPGDTSRVRSLHVLDNGDLLVGGRFNMAGDIVANNIARWDGAMWHAVGQGVGGQIQNATVNVICPVSDDEIIVGGIFPFAGASFASNVARFTNEWAAMGEGIGSTSPVYSTIVAPDGDLITGGTFIDGDSLVAHQIARWEDGSVNTLGNGFNESVRDMAYLPNGDLVVVGAFTTADGNPANRVARWDGVRWHPLGDGLDDIAFAVAVLENGDIVVGGHFDNAGGASAPRIARWDGSAWHPMGIGFNNNVYDLLVLSNGDLVAVGQFTAENSADGAHHIARWNGKSWSRIPFPLSDFSSFLQSVIALPNGDLVVTGAIEAYGNIARWNGSTWQPFGAGLDYWGYSIALLPNGHIAAGGTFTAAGGAPANHIAVWDGAAWSPLEQGLNTFVRTLAVQQHSGGAFDLVVGGDFALANGAVSPRLARYRFGATSSPDITVHPDDELICSSGVASFTVDASGNETLSYQWQVNTDSSGDPQWCDLTDLQPGGGCLGTGGGGPSHAIFQGVNSSTLTIGDVSVADAREYRCAVSAGSCGAVFSEPAALTICAADFNCSGAVNSQDFFDFLAAFFDGVPTADFNNDEAVNSQDFFDFLAAFFAGC